MSEGTTIHLIGDLFDEWVETQLSDNPYYKLGKHVGHRRGYRQAMEDGDETEKVFSTVRTIDRDLLRRTLRRYQDAEGESPDAA